MGSTHNEQHRVIYYSLRTHRVRMWVILGTAYTLGMSVTLIG